MSSYVVPDDENKTRVEIIAMAPSLKPSALPDLKDILQVIQANPQAEIKDCRTTKIRHYLQVINANNQWDGLAMKTANDSSIPNKFLGLFAPCPSSCRMIKNRWSVTS